MADKDDLDLLTEDRQDELLQAPSPSGDDAEEVALDTQKKISELQDANQDREERKRYALLSYILAGTWLVAIVAVVVLQGVGLFGFYLSDSVLITFISTNTASVIGVLVVVVRYLFPGR